MHKFPSVKTWDGLSVPEFVLPKRDGHQVIVTRSQTGQITATTRTPIDITDDIKWVLAPLYEGMPLGTCFAGELWVRGGDCSSVKTAMKAKDPALRWDAFAVLDPSVSCVLKQEEYFCRHGIPHISYLRHNLDCPVELEEWMEEREREFNDFEGFILRDKGMIFKWKPELTIDLVIAGHKDGEGKFLGQLGAFICETSEGYPVARCSGMDDETRLECSLDSDSYIGKVVEVEYQSVGSKGRLRHPRFVRFREDKKPEDCSAWQDDRLTRFWHSQEGKDERNRKAVR